MRSSTSWLIERPLFIAAASNLRFVAAVTRRPRGTLSPSTGGFVGRPIRFDFFICHPFVAFYTGAESFCQRPIGILCFSTCLERADNARSENSNDRRNGQGAGHRTQPRLRGGKAGRDPHHQNRQTHSGAARAVQKDARWRASVTMKTPEWPTIAEEKKPTSRILLNSLMKSPVPK